METISEAWAKLAQTLKQRRNLESALRAHPESKDRQTALKYANGTGPHNTWEMDYDRLIEGYKMQRKDSAQFLKDNGLTQESGPAELERLNKEELRLWAIVRPDLV